MSTLQRQHVIPPGNRRYTLLFKQLLEQVCFNSFGNHEELDQ